MPIFLYRHPKTKKIVEIIQSVHEKHEYIKNGIIYERQFTVPQMNTDVKLDPFDKKAFVEKTGNIKKGATLGDLYNRSADLSYERANKIGAQDPIKLNFAHEYQKARKGKKLPKKSGNNYFENR